jgi:hypothetical protein
MRNFISLVFAFLLITACKNADKKDSPKVNNARLNNRDSSNNDEDDKPVNKDKNKKDNSPYNWTRKDQNKFLEDCKRESSQELSDEKLKDFCSCMLGQARKYYPTYNEMDKKSNEEADRKIIANCAEYLDENEND